MRRARLRAPELTGRGWLNTGGRDITLADLRGKVVVLDFWTFCCVNCLHVLDELRPVEETFGEALVVIGVHSPKFAHEADPDALAAAVERYAVHHPVLDDPELATWQAYAARAWPTLVVVDPEGYIVASMSGEGHGPGLSVLVSELLAEHETKGTLSRGDGPYVAASPPETRLRFPGKAAEWRGRPGTTVVSDTRHHEIVLLDEDLESELGRWAADPALVEPQGVLVLPAREADRVGVDVVVADSVGHRIRGLSLESGHWVTLAGTGRQLRERTGGGRALDQDLSTPWDLAWWQGRLVVAMAGTHQLWSLDLHPDPADNVIEVLAGTSSEGIRDGAGDQAWFAQPSGLAVSADGEVLWVADSETSALRRVTLAANANANADAWAGAGVVVDTVAGQGLFDFGHVDGPTGQALMQHPLGVCALVDGSVLVADTYNGALRRVDVRAATVSTVATGLVEPSDVVADGLPDDDGVQSVIVVESGAHRVGRFAIWLEGDRVDGDAQATQRPATALASGEVDLVVGFVPPTGQKLDDRWGDPTQLMVSATPEELLVEGAGIAQGLRRRLVLAAGVGDGTLHVSVRAAACDGDPVTGEVPEHAACHLYQQDWGIPLVLGDGPRELRLDLRGA